MLGEDDQLCYKVFTSCLGKSECYVELVQLEIGCGPVKGNTNHMEVAYWCEEYGKNYYDVHADMVLHIYASEQIYEKKMITITHMYNMLIFCNIFNRYSAALKQSGRPIRVRDLGDCW